MTPRDAPHRPSSTRPRLDRAAECSSPRAFFSVSWATTWWGTLVAGSFQWAEYFLNFRPADRAKSELIRSDNSTPPVATKDSGPESLEIKSS